jgi:hypothetical protein
MTNAELIAEGRKLLEAATPGPWIVDVSRTGPGAARCSKQAALSTATYPPVVALQQAVVFGLTLDKSASNVDLSVFARNNLAALLDLAEEAERLRKIVEDAHKQLEGIVCHAGEDRGIVFLSNDSPTHYDPECKCQVYDHENFSPLGDALIALHNKLEQEQPK